MSIHDGAFFGLIVSGTSTVASARTVASAWQHKFLCERNCMVSPPPPCCGFSSVLLVDEVFVLVLCLL